MSNYFITFLSISIIIFVGYLTTIIIIGNKTLPKIGYIAVSFAAGCGILSLGMFVVSLFGVRFTLPNILVFLIPSIFCLVFINRLRRKKPNWPNSISHTFIGTQKLNPLGILLIIIISINVILCVIENVTLPIHNCTDATAIYGYKAKILYYEPIRYSNYFQDLTKSFSHLDYPLLWPLTETFVYIFLNQANDQFSKLLSPLFFVCLLLAMYSFVRISSGRTYSLFFAALLSTSPMLVYDSTLS
ncbi:MAG: hypothetical protein M1155_00390, partial [Patescibacteria group bacterium]|nr:hypothetical protein [Patescibacteria group bacterium]